MLQPPGSNQLGPVLRSYVLKLQRHVANWPCVSMKHQVPKSTLLINATCSDQQRFVIRLLTPARRMLG